MTVKQRKDLKMHLPGAQQHEESFTVKKSLTT